jgi:hypothetical protein
MRTNILLSACVTAGLVVAGCSSKDAQVQAQPNTDGDDTGSDDPTFPMPGDGSESGGADDDDTGDDTNGPGTSASGFIDVQDGGSPTFECDPWTQDCPDGQKCNPWANDGGTWNATKCVPLDANPAQVGDPCMVEGDPKSGLDNCMAAAMCWAVDAETHIGTCVGFCTGTEANPSCDDPGTTCSITNGGSLILCLPVCDPLLQNCVNDQGCYGVGSHFICAPNASQPDAGNYGDPCAFLNVCNPGLFCAAAGAVPNCQGASGCCSEFCDITSAEGAAQCQGAAGGQECVPWFEQNQAPPGFEDVGGCSIPS